MIVCLCFALYVLVGGSRRSFACVLPCTYCWGAHGDRLLVFALYVLLGAHGDRLLVFCPVRIAGELTVIVCLCFALYVLVGGSR